jgi:prevent-host-death family protein
MVQHVSMQDAQSSLSEIVAIAGEGGGPVVLERDGRPLAVIVSVEDMNATSPSARRSSSASFRSSSTFLGCPMTRLSSSRSAS